MIIIPIQDCMSLEQAVFCENLSFSPWHSLPEHRPLGLVNRVRKVAYREISRLRHDLNKAPRRGADRRRDLRPPRVTAAASGRELMHCSK